MKRTTTVWVAVASLITAQAWAADFYVNGAIGNDSWNGQSPVWVSGTIGPRATIGAGLGLLGSGTGNVLNVAAGAYSGLSLPAIGGTSLVGAGSAVTSYDRAAGATAAWDVNQNGTQPTIIKGITLTDSTTTNGLFINSFGWGGAAQPNILDDVRIVNLTSTAPGFRIFNSSVSTTNTGGFIFRDFDLQNATATGPGSVWRMRGTSTANPFPLVFDGGTWSGNTFSSYNGGSIFDWNANAGNLVISDLTYQNNNGMFFLNRTLLGVNTVTSSLFQDNPNTGLPLGNVGAGADVIVQGSTFRETGAGGAQATGMSLTVPASTNIGKMRFIDTVFDGGTTGITLSVAGVTAQTHPIELKDVVFNTTTTGLNITGAGASNIWYIDPTQSGASGTATTLVSGGRMTVYGDANLDQVLDSADMSIFWLNFPTYTGNATWAMGDFNMDGNVDVFDMGYMGIPEPGSLSLLAIAALLACQRRRRRA